MNLYINSTNNRQTIIRLDEREYVFEYDSPRSQNVMKAIMDALDAEKKDLIDLTSITVAVGPGSFTGIRAGLSIANALSFSLEIPINGKPFGTTILPEYGAEPSITKSKENFKDQISK